MTILWWARTCCSTQEPVYSWDWCFTVGLIHFSWEIKWDLELCHSKPAVCLAAWLFPLTRCWQWIPISLNWWGSLKRLFMERCSDVSYTLMLKQKQTTCQFNWLVKSQLFIPSNRYALLSLWNPWTWEIPALDLTRSDSWKMSTCNAGSTPKPETKGTWTWGITFSDSNRIE